MTLRERRAWNMQNNIIAIFILSPLGKFIYTLLPLGNKVKIIAH